MKKIFTALLLAVTVIFASCSAEQTKSAEGRFSIKPTPAKIVMLNISQGDLVGETNNITYGSESPVLSFKLASSDGSTVSVSTVSFLLHQTGLVTPTYGSAAKWQIYPVVSGSIDTSNPISNTAQLADDGISNNIDGVLTFKTVDAGGLGESYALQVSSSKEYVIVGPVVDDGLTNTNLIGVSSADSSNVSLAKWAWSRTAGVLMSGSFSSTQITGSASSSSD